MALNYLHTPVSTIIAPPIETTVQELPLEKLSWDDFEKLCLAIVQVDFSINDCEIYGIKGQAQEGIDIYARQPDGRYSSYQCKRYQEFDLEDLDKAVIYFKKKKFYKLSDTLHICTACEWNKTQIQDRFEELKTELKKDKISLVKWDKIQLSRYLKSNPQIVYDFFGIEWVKRFNGDIGLQHISKDKKLDAVQVARYRKELYEFYSTIFNIQDPGIPIKELNNPYNIQERFIIPDILSNVQETDFESVEENPSSVIPSVSSQKQDQFYYEEYWYADNEERSRFDRFRAKENTEDSSIFIRIKIDDALIGSNKNIIIGDPGAGKSTLLRYIVLDILGPNPNLENIALQFGKLLPVWLPFAFITKHLTQDDTLNISELLKLWFKSFDKEHLFDIAKDALNDERLFLIVDGIDEWNNISSAQQAISKIEITRQLFDCQILYSSRPYGFRVLKDFFKNLKVLNLAGFSQTQQQDFIEKWYSKWASLQKAISDNDFAKYQSNNFIKELEQAGDLKKLAETPLLLSILIIQKIRDSVLPRNKLEALKEITQYLINKHPIKRVMDAGLVQNKVDDVDFKEIFCELAIHIQKSNNDGVILKSDAQKAIENYLTIYANYDKARAKIRSKEFIDIGANSFGIIIEKSIDEISFSHKQFQEFLAAQYLSESDQELSSEFINKHAANPAFHQVITNFFGLIPHKQIKAYNHFYRVLNNSEHEAYQKEYLKLLSFEVSINMDNTPTEIMNSSFDLIVADFEYETDPIFKEALLKRILYALHNGRLKDRVQKFFLQYFPSQSKYRDNRVISLKYVKKLNTQQIEFLEKAFINGSIEIRHDASYTLKRHIKNQQILTFLKKIILNCDNPDILAFAVNSIITNEIDPNIIESLVNSVEYETPMVQFFLLKYKVFTKRQTEDDLEKILSIANEMHYELKQEIIDLLIDGYEQSEKLKHILIKSIRGKHRFEGTLTIDREVTWKVLFHCFNKDTEVIKIIKREFEEEEYPFLSSGRYYMLRHLVHYFKDNQELIPAVEYWLLKRLEKFRFTDSDVAFASVYVHSDFAKKHLLEDLPLSVFPHWNVMALLEGWKGDKHIKNELKVYFRTGDIARTSYAAQFIPDLFDEEKEEAVKLLQQMLFNKNLEFRDRALLALIELDKSYFESTLLEKFLEEIDSLPKDDFAQYYNAIDNIVKNFSSNQFVKLYVLTRIEEDPRLYGLFVQYFSDQTLIEQKQLKKSTHLSKDLRLLIIDQFNELPVLFEDFKDKLLDFHTEMEEEVKSDMAVCLFTQLRQKNVTEIIQLSKPLVFGKGFDYEIQRNIAFIGFLISNKLDDYFSMESFGSQLNEKASPVNIFTDDGYRSFTSGLMVKALINNFDYLISLTGKDFKFLIERRATNNEIEHIWGFFAKYSVKSSPSYQYIIEFISENVNTITNQNIINFLSRVSPKSSALKNILLRILNEPESKNMALAGKLLGTNFKKDDQVYEEVKKISNYTDSGRIIALCNGWPGEPILNKIFKEVITHQLPIDDYAGFHLKFLFRDTENLTSFLSKILDVPRETKQYHRYFYIPMIKRLRKDVDFASVLKKMLLSTNSINEKISYYNLLSEVNMVDNDVKSWKETITTFKNDYGYDIVSNKTVRLKNILHDNSF